MLRAVALGDTRGMRRLVLGRAAEFVEGKRDGADVALAGVAHQAEQRPGIDACREKQADFHVGQQMRPHAVDAPQLRSRSSIPPREWVRCAVGQNFGKLRHKGCGARGPAASIHCVWPAGSAGISR